MGTPLSSVVGAIFRAVKPKGNTPFTRNSGDVLEISTKMPLGGPINMTGFTPTSLTGITNVAALQQPKPDPVPKKKKGNNNGSESGGSDEAPVYYTAADVKFNLPPHKWSLPINPNSLSSNIDNDETVPHSVRRARMWCYGTVELTPKAPTVSNGGKSRGSFASESVPEVAQPLDDAWGFQFLWNPEKLNNSLSRNSNVTPNAADKLSEYYNLFTAMEAMTFSITIDRVNDFAAIKGLTRNISNNGGISLLNPTWQSMFDKYYAGNGYPSSPKNPENPLNQLKDLMRLGTMADIEYIYKMINGEGVNGVARKNALGRKTADIGYLKPTPIAVQFGPTANSLSYVGWIDGVSVTHTMFTEDMIPIHSEVVISFVAFARTTLSQG